VDNTVGNDFNSEALSIADGFVPALAVTDHTWEFERLHYPAAIFLPVEVDRQIHLFIIPLRTRNSCLD